MSEMIAVSNLFHRSWSDISSGLCIKLIGAFSSYPLIKGGGFGQRIFGANKLIAGDCVGWHA